MLKALPLIILVALSAPALASERSAELQVAQQPPAPQQAPKRDCEKRQEGVGT